MFHDPSVLESLVIQGLQYILEQERLLAEDRLEALSSFSRLGTTVKEGAIGLGTARKDCSLASCFFLPRTKASAKVLGVGVVGSDLSASGASLWSSCSLLSSTEVLTPELGVGVVGSGKSLTFLLELQEG